jgi:Nucleotidyl transferase AbiEii toxin, Type IV TA system
MLQKQTVSPDCLQLIYDLMDIQSLEKFRLVGGTALALQYGHRKSIDIDLFSGENFDNNSTLMALESSLYPERIENVRTYPFGFFCDIKEIKVDFMYWGHSFITEAISIEGIRMAKPEEILAMKLHAATSRRTKKDLYDIALLLDHFTIADGINLFEKKYPEHDSSSVIKQLIYFDEADKSDSPEMLIPLTWEQAKEKITSAVDAYWKSELTKP